MSDEAPRSTARRPLLPFLRFLTPDPEAPRTSVSGAYAPAPGAKVAAAPALARPPAAPLRAGVGLVRTPVPTVAHAPGTVPYFPPEKPAPKVEVTEEVYKPWSFAVTPYGIHGKEVPRRRVLPSAPAQAPSSTPSSDPNASSSTPSTPSPTSE